MDDLVEEVLQTSRTLHIQPPLKELPKADKDKLDKILGHLQNENTVQSWKQRIEFIVLIQEYDANDYKTYDYWDNYVVIVNKKYRSEKDPIWNSYWGTFKRELQEKYDLKIDEVQDSSTT